MKKSIIALCIALCLMPAARADEGMWLLPLLEKMNADALRNLGSRLTPDQIYSINHSSIKDAVVQFGGGCTGELISDRGLLVTNHHCGYGSIQSLSSTEHNYLEDGFFAKSLKEEIPVPGLTVKFLQSMKDVTDKINKGADRKKLIEKARKANPNCLVEIVSFFNENVYYLIVSKVYTDVRFVGAPPASAGKFGGDTDNWMWPRHTCDFSMFRVYAGKDNEPADYSPENVPMKPRQSLKISLKGVQEGDFAMIMGYPGRTQRYQTASQLEEMLALNDIRIDARTVRQDVLRAEMRANPKVNLQYASKYASSSNGWKKWQGMREAFAKLEVIKRENEKEAQIQAWINSDPKKAGKWGSAIAQISEVVSSRADAYKAYTLLNETLGRIELLSFARSTRAVPYKDYDVDVDRKAAMALTSHYLERVQGKDLVGVSLEEIADIFEKSVFTSEEKRAEAEKNGYDMEKDPARLLADRVSAVLKAYVTELDAVSEGLRDATKAYGAALLEWNKDGALYPDANMTCRLTYGTVKGYEPKDGVVFKHYTTLKGVMEKETPGDYEFRVHPRLKEIYNNGDYGQYADAQGQLVTCFLTNLDITGGNSGSPVLDADGNLIGLAFDGNWEAMSGDVIFEPELQRCICVDIRYVLLLVDKWGGAGYLLNEMNIVK